jgi:S1-C subfamily serine protease
MRTSLAAVVVLWGCAAPRAALTSRVPTLRERVAGIATAKGDIRELYRKVAPATVLVRSPHGFGTGIIIDGRGYVLTNHHVIANAQSVDFKRKVTVELGALNPSGFMEKQPQAHVAWVLKSDPVVDLAVLKLEAPPPGLQAVEISPTDPTPGEPVAALGHGGIGLLWAIRDGEVSSIGKLATHMARLLGSSPDLEAERAQVASDMPALVIQSSCQISPGDSGGPLVNRAGQLVGVNAFLQSEATAPVAANFHIHVAEVREFLKEVPAEPVARAPDPHELARGGRLEKIDADGDGIEESQAYDGERGAVVFVDLGEGATIAVASEGGHTLLWSGDRLVVEGAKGSGRGVAFRLSGKAPPLKEADDALLFDRSSLSAAAATRFEKIEKAVLEPWGLPVNEPLDQAPNPYAAARWRLVDADGDRKIDSAIWGTTVLIDPRQAFSQPIRHAPIALVRKERRAWCLLPSQTLATEDAESGAVTLGDARGRTLLPLALEGLDPTERKRALTAVRRLAPRLFTQGSPWPNPVADVGADVVAEESGVKGLEYAVVSVVGSGNASLVFEVDRDTVSPSPGEMERRARKGQGVDMAWVRRSETEWFLYDTDHDGTLDVMLFQPPTGPVEAFRYQDGAVKRAPELDHGRTVRPTLFKDENQQKAFAALAKVFFNAEVVEP